MKDHEQYNLKDKSKLFNQAQDEYNPEGAVPVLHRTGEFRAAKRLIQRLIMDGFLFDSLKGLKIKALSSLVVAPQTTGTTYAVVADSNGQLSYSKSTQASLNSSGIASKDLSDTSTTQVIPHGLGSVPRKVTFKIRTIMNATTGSVMGDGVYDGTNNLFIAVRDLTGAAAPTQWTSTAYAIGLTDRDALPSSSGQTGVVTVDATNITITWTKNGTPTSVLSFLWEAV